MKYKTFILFIIIFYFLALFQTSFLVHFSILGYVPNLILLIIIFWNLLEEGKKNTSILASFTGGFFLDIFSSHFIGFNILILVSVSLLIKVIIKRYVGFSFRS